ncbi:serine hydrolase domain-containing protein [Aestuariivivens sediminicola]|uniref:serine hydrolase domain-containing protein n=1 Tax=Aestuariivivens sediminicola TaxID=2913560 RepID=UPI001F56B0F2|nr:serine hydrolase domain-containing protein [Aestuariivivens sediminicola]
MKTALLFILSTVLLTVSCKERDASTAERVDNNEQAMDTILEGIFRKNELMGMSVLLIDEGKVQWHKSFGLSNVANGSKVTSNTKYRVASISKTVTTLALMQLMEKGKVDLHTDVSDYLGWELRNPNFPDIPITLYHLLTHTSGISDGEGYGRFSKEMIEGQLPIKALFDPDGAYFTEDMYSKHAAGTFFNYTNSTWGIIASVIEIASQMSFDSYCRTHIFNPMGMHADFDPANVDNIDDLAVLYRFKEGQWTPQTDDYQGQKPPTRMYEGYQPGQNGLLFGPQGNLRASAEDLAQIIKLFLNGGSINGHQIITKASADMMLKSHWDYDGDNGNTWNNFYLSYGLGIHRITNTPKSDIIFEDRTMAGHPGIAYGLLSDMYFNIPTQTGIVFITNGSKLAFKYGKETTFYQVEEDVFKAVYPLLKK